MENAKIAAMEAAVGGALARWATVEIELYKLFICLCAPAMEPNTFSVIYGAITGIRDKLKVVDALAAYKYDREAKAEWKKLFDKLDKEIGKRNKIAHWVVYLDNDEARFGNRHYEPDKLPELRSSFLKTDQVLRMHGEILDLAHQITTFREKQYPTAPLPRTPLRS